MKFHVKMIIACIAIAVLLCLAFVLYHNPNKTQKPYNSTSEEIRLIDQKWSEYYQNYYYSQQQKVGS